MASFTEQRDPQAKPAVLQYFGKTAVNNHECEVVLTYQLNLLTIYGLSE